MTNKTIQIPDSKYSFKVDEKGSVKLYCCGKDVTNQLDYNIVTDMAYMIEDLVEKLQNIIAIYEKNSVGIIPDKRIYEKQGDTIYLLDEGDIVPVILDSPHIEPDGSISITVFAEDKIFPYREPDSEHDDDPSDWCQNWKKLSVEDFGKIAFFTKEEMTNANVLDEEQLPEWTQEELKKAVTEFVDQIREQEQEQEIDL